MHRKKISTAVYNKNPLYKELLHHQLEYSHYEVLHSSTDIKTLLSNFKKHPAHILVVDSSNLSAEVTACLPEFCLHADFPVSILFYNSPEEPHLPKNIKFKFKNHLHHCNSGMASLYDCLDSVIAGYSENKAAEIIRQTVLLPPTHPMYKISTNRTYIQILRLFSEGKNTRQISDMTGLAEESIKTYAKKMREDSDCHSTAHLVSMAKDCHLI
jgi:DNA-binding NarL/FixJ family response regulator